MKSCILLLLSVLSLQAAEHPAWEAQINEHRPIAWWNFDDAEPELKKHGEVKFVEGPTRRISATLPEKNIAAKFDGAGDYFSIPDQVDFDFDNGDAITIEAWVQLRSAGGNRYIIGKGRTAGKDNQNWALRLMNINGNGRISFLFRSRPAADHAGDWHRWNSQVGISPGTQWHHVAVTYTFGEPKSIKGYLNGQPVKGSWDMGGATTHAPVVDDAEVWIGSTMGGSPGNSWHGCLDEIAIYRKILPAKAFAGRVDFGPGIPPPDWSKLSRDTVHTEVYSGMDSDKAWPQRVSGQAETFEVPAFGLVDLPLKYTARGSRDRRSTEWIRMKSWVRLPEGAHQLLIRAPSLTRLSIDGAVVGELSSYKVNGSAHGHMRKRPDIPYPRARLGTRDKIVTFHSSGNDHQVMLEAVAGHGGMRFTLGELLVAIKDVDENWFLLKPADSNAPTPFRSEDFERYQQQQLAQLNDLSTQRRTRMRKQQSLSWQKRHAVARNHITSLPPLPTPELPAGFKAQNPIDHFLAEKIHRAQQAEARQDPDAALARQAIGLLDEKCFRCHGKKDKGELKLNAREAALAAGESGAPAVVPGQAAKSEIIVRMLSQDEDERMPPKGDRLAAEDIASVKKWIDEGAPWAIRSKGVTIPRRLDEAAFLRRLYLDTIGILPTPDQIRSYLADTDLNKTRQLVDELLAHPRHADHWVGYWQDVLAENPRLVKGKLNNTGAFRWWLHEALLDKLPMDQFVYELVSFDGSLHEGGVAGFKVASENDAPMAAKAHVLATAFLGTEMKCARCHDAPYHSSKQQDLFALAAMLEGKSVKVPASSSVPATFFARLGNRKPLVEVTLKPNTPVKPAWPFEADEVHVIAPPPDSRSRLAWEITRPENPRFAQVMVNRIWKRYFGQGFVEPAEDWEGNPPSHPALLEYLARELVANGYAMDHLSRLILNSEAYQRAARAQPELSEADRLFEAPLKRRLTAEQLVDSLFAASGVPVYSEELTFDVPGAHTAAIFPTMGRPTRAWQFISLASDRDRPSLTLPYADSIVSLMKSFGWRSDRSEPRTDRDDDANVLQPGMLANGIFGMWITRLSPYSELTGLAMEASSPEQLSEELYLRFLSREPSETEAKAFVELLRPGFETRMKHPARPFTKALFVPAVREVSWENHLSPEANVFCAEIEKEAAKGPPTTDHLDPAWRMRMEDAVWSLVNAPEMQFVP